MSPILPLPGSFLMESFLPYNAFILKLQNQLYTYQVKQQTLVLNLLCIKMHSSKLIKQTRRACQQDSICHHTFQKQQHTLLQAGTDIIFLPPQRQIHQGRNRMGSYQEKGCSVCFRPSKPTPTTTITMQESPDNQVSRNTKNSNTIICSSKFLLDCSGQLNLITSHLFPCLSPTSHYQFQHTSVELNTSSESCEIHCHCLSGKNMQGWCTSYHYCQRLRLHYKHQEREKGNLTSVLNPAHILPTITRTQGPFCIQHHTPHFCTLLLL